MTPTPPRWSARALAAAGLALVTALAVAPSVPAAPGSGSLGSLDPLSSGSSGSSGSSVEQPDPDSEYAPDDDHFQFNDDPDAMRTTGAAPAFAADTRPDFGGRGIDVGPLRLRSAATGMYAVWQFGEFWPDVPANQSSSFTVLADTWGTVRIQEQITKECLRAYGSSFFHSRKPLISCEAASNSQMDEEVRWVIIPAQQSNAWLPDWGATGGFLLVNYRTARCLDLPGRWEKSDQHIDTDCKGTRAGNRQVFYPTGATQAETDRLVAAFTDLALRYATRNCADGGRADQFDCAFAPGDDRAWDQSTARSQAVCVAPAEQNNTGAPIDKELTVREDSGWTLKVGREFTAGASLEPKFLSALGLKVTAGLKISRDETWTSTLSEGTTLTLRTDPGNTSWISRQIRVRQVNGQWRFGTTRLPWTSEPGPVDVPLKNDYELSYNSAYFTPAHPFPGCATLSKVEPTTRPTMSQSGQTLTATPGAWPDDAWTVGYRWYRVRDGRREILDATDSPTYTRMSTDDRTLPIGVIVTGYRPGYAPTAVTLDAEPPLPSG